MGNNIHICIICGYPMIKGRKYHKKAVRKNLCIECLNLLKGAKQCQTVVELKKDITRSLT